MTSSPSFALAQAWANLSGDTASKLAQINAMTVDGPNVDVDIQQVAGYLLLQGIYPTLTAFAAGSPNSNATHDAALTAAKSLVAWVGLQNAPPVHMSQPAVLAAVTSLGNAVVAQETAVPGSTGFTQAILNGLLALGQTTQFWWLANGFNGPVTMSDAIIAGLS
jgi:hypothetical protein